MEIYADVDFYQNDYLMGRSEIIPLSEFSYWARAASQRINRNKVELEIIPDYLANCTCQVAETIFLDMEKQILSMSPSQSVGAYSKGELNIQQTIEKLKPQIDSIILDWLSNTDLHNTFVYRGV